MTFQVGGTHSSRAGTAAACGRHGHVFWFRPRTCCATRTSWVRPRVEFERERNLEK